MPKTQAIERLISLVEDETGAAEVGTGWKDDETVGWANGEPLEMTFGDVRKARAELEAIKSMEAIKARSVPKSEGVQ